MRRGISHPTFHPILLVQPVIFAIELVSSAISVISEINTQDQGDVSPMATLHPIYIYIHYYDNNSNVMYMNKVIHIHMYIYTMYVYIILAVFKYIYIYILDIHTLHLPKNLSNLPWRFNS